MRSAGRTRLPGVDSAYANASPSRPPTSPRRRSAHSASRRSVRSRASASSAAADGSATASAIEIGDAKVACLLQHLLHLELGRAELIAGRAQPGDAFLEQLEC